MPMARRSTLPAGRAPCSRTSSPGCVSWEPHPRTLTRPARQLAPGQASHSVTPHALASASRADTGAPPAGPRSGWPPASVLPRATSRRSRPSSAIIASSSARGMLTISASKLTHSSLVFGPPFRHRHPSLDSPLAGRMPSATKTREVPPRQAAPMRTAVETTVEYPIVKLPPAASIASPIPLSSPCLRAGSSWPAPPKVGN